MPPRKLSFTSVLEQSKNNLWGCHFTVPRSIAEKLIAGKSRRVVCTLNGAVEYQCALIPDGNGSWLITVNKQLQKRLKVNYGSRVEVALRKDDSKYGLPVPREFKELLRQDKEGERLFHSLTPGRQRTLLYIVGQAKDTDIRLFRGNVIVRHLKSNNGKINYRRLAVELRGRTKPRPIL